MCRRLREQARSHRDFGCSGDGRSTPYQCGSEPARESAVSGNDDVECAGAFASRLAPTGILVAMKMVDLPRISVEASLLAKAQSQAMTMLTVPPPSRAGCSHRDFGCDEDGRSAPYQCGSEPARESGLSGDDDVDCAAAFASRPAPTGFGCLFKIEINQKAAPLGRRQIFCASHWYGNPINSMASHCQDELPDAKGVFE